MSVTRLLPPIPLNTPKGQAQAMFMIDYSTEHSLYWVCFIDSTAECWMFSNEKIRACKNITMGRELDNVVQDPNN